MVGEVVQEGENDVEAPLPHGTMGRVWRGAASDVEDGTERKEEERERREGGYAACRGLSITGIAPSSVRLC